MERAFAEELRISVPWSSLATDPLDVRASCAAPMQPALDSCGRAYCRCKCVAWMWFSLLVNSAPRGSRKRSAHPMATRRRCWTLMRHLRRRQTATVRFRAVAARCNQPHSMFATDEPSEGAAGWVVGALNGINCRLVDVSVALSYGNQQSVRVAVGLAHALTVPPDGEAVASPPQLSLERLCKEVLLERVCVELSHSGAKVALRCLVCADTALCFQAARLRSRC